MEYIDAFYHALINILPFTSQGQQAFFFMLVGVFIGFWPAWEAPRPWPSCFHLFTKWTPHRPSPFSWGQTR